MGVIHYFVAALLFVVSHLAHADSTVAPVSLIAHESPPFAMAQHGQPVGFSVDLLEEIFQRAGVPYELLMQPGKRALKSAQQIPRTCTFPVGRSQAREAHYAWMGPIAISRLGLYSHPQKTLDLETLNDAKQQVIGTGLGSTTENYLQQRGYILFTSVTPEQGFQMLMKERIDLWAVDVRSADVISLRNHVDLGKPELAFYTATYYLACHPSLPESMLNKLNSILVELYVSGWVEKALHLKL